MKRILTLILVFFSFLQILPAQEAEYNIQRLNINDKNDDFGPTLWKNHLVFSSERLVRMISYKDSKTKRGVTNIIKSELINDSTYSTPSVFSKDLLSNHNDGPASFTPDGNKIYYARPLEIGNSAKTRNNSEIFAGIFTAEFVNDKWVNIQGLPFNNPDYILTQPAISRDEKFIIFSSNLPGTLGRGDLFISYNESGNWSEPINLGERFNTPKSEHYPFLHYNGDLYYTSNGLGDGEDFDIYFCEFNGTSWEDPVALPAPFNSDFNDDSFYINYSKHQGYFSSNRGGPSDIYYFEKTSIDQFACDALIEESFCFKLPKIQESEIEGLPLKYEYLLNDEQVIDKNGEVYCFPEEGSYKLTLNIVDTISGALVFTREHFEFLIERVRQPFINVADSLPLNELVEFNTKSTYLPRIKLDEYLWDFGDNSGDKGESVQHYYSATGQYKVTLTIFGEPIGGEAPQFCSYKTVYVGKDIVLEEGMLSENPLDLAGFIRMSDYTPLPENLYYTNLVRGKDEVKMTHFLQSSIDIPLSDERFANLDTTKLHVFKDRNNNFDFYYGEAFNMKDAYNDYLRMKEAGFTEAKIKNLKNAKLDSDEHYIDAQDDKNIGYAIVLEKSKKRIENYRVQFREINVLGKVVEEVHVAGEGYYYIVGNEKDINDAMSIYNELKFSGIKSIRIKDFSTKSVVSFLSKRAEDISTDQYMIELFRSDDYIDLNDSIFKIIGNRKIIALRQSDRKIAYYVNGGGNLLSARNTLKQLKRKGFSLSQIKNFKYERLEDEGYFITEVEEEEFSYIITFESSDNPIDLNEKFMKTLMGYSVYEEYDPITKKFVYQVDVGKELSEATMLANDMRKDSLNVISIVKMKYNSLTDDEFYISAIDEGEEQMVIVLGTFDQKQNIYKTFSDVRSFQNIREIYNAENGKYTYIIGGFLDLEDAYYTLEDIKESGIENVYIRKFIYDPLNDDQFYLANVDEEIELFRITIARGMEELSPGDPQFDNVRDIGEVIGAFDADMGEFIVAVGKSNDLPIALKQLGAVVDEGYDSVRVEKYIYGSQDKDRFAIRDINKEDRYYAIELFRSDSVIAPESIYFRDLSRKYPIISKYDPVDKKYVYLIASINTVEGAQKYYKYAKKDGFNDAKIVSIVYETLAHDVFTIEPIGEEDNISFVVSLLRTKNQVGTENVFFNEIPEGIMIEEVYDKNTGFYNYMVTDAKNIHEANFILAKVKNAGYLNAHVDKMVYTSLEDDLFTLESISDENDEFTITLLKSDEKLGIDHQMFEEISKAGVITEYYDYKTEEYIYTFGKSGGMINAFEQLKVAQENGFADSEIQRFVYSELNADHFYLETIEQDESMFTIVLAQSKTKYSDDKFAVFTDMGYTVREKYIESRDLWVYSLSLTENVAQAEKLTRQAKDAGFTEAKLNRFVYTRLSGDDYYLESIKDDEQIFMIVLTESKERKDVNSDPLFDNLDGRYEIEEIYDDERGVYKYYIGKPMKDIKYANAFKNELVAMGYIDVRIMQFIYSTLGFDEEFIETIEDTDDLVFVLDGVALDPLFVYFGFDQYFLEKQYRTQIDELLVKTIGHNYSIVLEGHTDDIGDEHYNLWLSEMRANSVKKYMVNAGADPETITIDPIGESNPIVPNDSLKNRRLNRSVIILPKKG